MFPVKDEALARAVENVLYLQWNDTEKARTRLADGSYVLSPRHADGINAQETLLKDVEGVFAGRYTAPEGAEASGDAGEERVDE